MRLFFSFLVLSDRWAREEAVWAWEDGGSELSYHQISTVILCRRQFPECKGKSQVGFFISILTFYLTFSLPLLQSPNLFLRIPVHPGASRCEPWKIGLKKVFKKSGSSRNGCYWLRAPSILLSAGMWLQVASVHFGQRLDFLWTNLCKKSEI